MELVPLYEKTEIIGVVNFTNNLDKKHKHSFYTTLGHHLGIGVTKDNKYYVCYGSEFENEPDYAKVITKNYAARLIIQNNPNEDLYLKIIGEPMPFMN